MTYAFLERLYPTLESSPRSCDLCGNSEIEDILDRPFGDPLLGELRPMYRDTRYGITLCQRCAESGVYLGSDVDEGGAL